MEPLPGKTISFICFDIDFLISINLISDNWISNRGEMHSDLMGSSSKKINLKKGIFSSNYSLIAKFCFSEFRIRWINCCHFLPIIRISSDERLNISSLILYNSYHKSKVCLMNSSLRYLKLESMHGFIIFCYNNQSTCIFIETMYDSWSLYSIDNRRIEFRILLTYTK